MSDRDEQAAFVATCRHQDMAAFHRLLGDCDVDNGAGIHPPLLWAALHGNTEMFDALVAKGADPNVTNKHGWTALHYAAFAGRAHIARKLLELGAKVDARTKNNFPTPLHKAATEGYLDVVEILLEAGANPAPGCPTGMTVIEAAQARQRTDVVARLARLS